MPKFSRRKLLAGAAPFVAAPLAAKVVFGEEARAERLATHRGHDHPHQGHAAMIGDQVPAVGGPRDLDALLYPPEALPYSPGRVREYTLTAIDKDIEIAPGIFFP